MTNKDLAFLARHGEDAWSPESREPRDILTERGVDQIEHTTTQIAQRLMDEYGMSFDDTVGLYHSPKPRARASADLMNEGLSEDYDVVQSSTRDLAASAGSALRVLDRAEEPARIGVSHKPYCEGAADQLRQPKRFGNGDWIEYTP